MATYIPSWTVRRLAHHDSLVSAKSVPPVNGIHKCLFGPLEWFTEDRYPLACGYCETSDLLGHFLLI
jgi:hypothetical protein